VAGTVQKSGAWPLLALRQAFLNGTLERVLDPDSYLRNRLPEFVMRGDMGFASGQKAEGGYSRLWFAEMLPPDEIAFDSDVYLLLPRTAVDEESKWRQFINSKDERIALDALKFLTQMRDGRPSNKSTWMTKEHARMRRSEQ
jgi:hypothetical protein